jgi:flavin reductase (DIM6/NTAB) family NADH-FMN oxidoreductase RutF
MIPRFRDRFQAFLIIRNALDTASRDALPLGRACFLAWATRMAPAAPSDLARALGRLPSGLYICTTELDGRPVGFLCSFVQQASLSPPMVTVAIGRDRPILGGLRRGGAFGLSVLDESSRRSMSAFARRLPDGESPFDRVAWTRTPTGVPVLTEALAWLECRTVGDQPAGDHVLLIAEVVAGELLRDGEPLTHLRRDGLGY